MKLTQVVLTLMLISLSATAQVWTNVFGLKTAGNKISTIKCDEDGALWMGGFWVDSLRLLDTTVVAVDYSDCYVLKTDTSGRISRFIRFGGTGFDNLYDLGINNNGSVIVIGNFQGTMTAGDSSVSSPGGESMFLAEFGDGPTPRWLTTATATAGKSISLLGNGGIFVAGHMKDTTFFGKSDTLFSHGKQDFFVGMYSPDGALRWVRGGGGTEDDFAKTVAAGTENALYVAGCFYDSIYFNTDTLRSSSTQIQSFAARLDSLGNTKWILPVSGDAAVNVEKLVVDDADNLYATGFFSGTLTIDTLRLEANNEYEFFLAAFTADGRIRWLKHAELASGNDISFGKNNELFVTGNFKQRTTFGTHFVESVDIEDIFICSYSPDGTCNWVMTAGGCRSAIGWRIASNKRNIFITGEVDANRTCASCPMHFGPFETPYTLEDRGRTFLAVADFTISNSVKRPTLHRLPYSKADRGVHHLFDLTGRQLHTMAGSAALQRPATGAMARQAVISHTSRQAKLSVEVR